MKLRAPESSRTVDASTKRAAGCRVAGWFALVLVTLLVPSPGAAHDIGTTRVEARFANDGTYLIDIVTDPAILLARANARTAGACKAADDASPASVRTATIADVRRCRGTLSDAVSITFGTGKAASQSEVSPEAAHASLAGGTAGAPQRIGPQVDGVVLRLTGSVPREARTFRFAWPLAAGAYALVVVGPGHEDPLVLWLDPGETSREVALDGLAPPPAWWRVLGEYLVLGFTHVVPQGLDHMLFVLGLVLLRFRAREVVLQVTTFTVAHSITLALAMLGWFSLSARIVEPLIAASIALVAVENLYTDRLTARRLGLVFACGLLHGLGFAGVLTDLGFPAAQFAAALAGFNVGVELAQLSVVGGAWLVATTIAWIIGASAAVRDRRLDPAWSSRLLSLALALVGVVWTIERLTSA